MGGGGGGRGWSENIKYTAMSALWTCGQPGSVSGDGWSQEVLTLTMSHALLRDIRCPRVRTDTAAHTKISTEARGVGSSGWIYYFLDNVCTEPGQG